MVVFGQGLLHAYLPHIIKNCLAHHHHNNNTNHNYNYYGVNTNIIDEEKRDFENYKKYKLNAYYFFSRWEPTHAYLSVYALINQKGLCIFAKSFMKKKKLPKGSLCL